MAKASGAKTCRDYDLGSDGIEDSGGNGTKKQIDGLSLIAGQHQMWRAAD